MPYSPIMSAVEKVGVLVDATPRQLDYMARRGLFGDDDPRWNAGSGSRRPWHLPHVPEVAWACARLVDMGIDLSQLADVAMIVRARRVKPEGEVLVVLADGALNLRSGRRDYGTTRVLRLDHWCATPDSLDRAAAVVRLRSFADVVPAGGVATTAGAALSAPANSP